MVGEHDLVELLQHGGQARASPVRDFEIHRQREPIHGMGEQELVGAVPLGHAEVGGESLLLGEIQDLGPGLKRGLLRQEGLVLDESATANG